MLETLKFERIITRWAPDGLPLNAHLAIFAALLLVPALVLSAVLIQEAAKERRREAEGRVVQLASDLADDISNELERSLTILRTLSYSTALANDDIPGFSRQLRDTMRSRDGTIVLVDPDGRQLLNTAVPPEATLSPYSEQQALQTAIETMQPVVTNVFWARSRAMHLANVLYPIVESGRVKRVLVASLTPERIQQVLNGQDIGEAWTTGVSDRNGLLIARSSVQALIPDSVLSTVLLSTSADERKPHLVTSPDGHRIVRALARTRIGGWTVAATAAEAHLDAAAFREVRNLAVGTFLILGLAGLLVVLYGRRLGAALQGMTQAVDSGPTQTIVKEATAAAHTLAQAAQDLRQSEERFRGIYQNAATGIAVTSPSGSFQSCNPAYAQMLGYQEHELRNLNFGPLIHPEDYDENMRLMGQLLNGASQSFEIENRYLGQGGRVIWVHKHVSLMRNGDGQPLHFIVLATDTTERRRQEHNLAIALERSKIAQHSARAALYELAPGTGEVIFDASIMSVAGFNAAEAAALGDGRRAVVHPDDATHALQAIDGGIAAREGYDVTYRLRHKRGHYVWVHDRASILKGERPADDRVIGMLLDISEQKAREEHVTLLLREVNHRSKNMLGLVQAIARQTATADPEEFLDRFGARIQALSANQDLLVRNDWGGVDVHELVATQLAHFADLPSARIAREGPALHLSPAAAQVLGMVLHELATNASKYGALSNETGRISVRWEVNETSFAITWQEDGGPATSPPAREGFGTTVIRNMARLSLDADVALDYPASGLRWHLACPLAKIADSGAVRGTPVARVVEQAPRGVPRTRVLVVEDEVLIAMEIADILTADGYEVVGPARSVEQALALIGQHGCDMGVLDMNLGAQTAEPIAAALTERETPFIIVSGYDRNQQPQALRGRPLVMKPIRTQVLLREIRRALDAFAA